jgi:hypothetical protein
MTALDHVHLNWFGDPPPDPAAVAAAEGGEPGEGQPAGSGEPGPLSAAPWLSQASDKYKRSEAFLQALLRGPKAVKSWTEVLDRMFAGEQQAAAHQATLTDLQAKLTAEQARAAELDKGGQPAPAPKFEAKDYEKIGPGKLPAWMEHPAWSAYSKDLSAYLGSAAEEIRAAALELKVAPTVAQRMVDLFAKRHVEAFKAGIEGQQELRQKSLERLKREWKGDFVANEELARRALATFGGNEMAEEVAASGFGDNPLMIRIFCNIGKLIGEGQMVPGRPAPSPEGAPAGMSDREAAAAASHKKRYPSMGKGV